MTTTRRNKRPTSYRLKKAVPALLLLGLLGYLGVTNVIISDSARGAIVQQAEAYVIEDGLLATGNALESNNAFSSVQSGCQSRIQIL